MVQSASSGGLAHKKIIGASTQILVQKVWLQMVAGPQNLSFVCLSPSNPPILFRLDALVCSLQRILQLTSFAISFFSLIWARTVMERGGQRRE